MSLSLINGGLFLSVNLGSGRLDTTFVDKDRFDDDEWHHVSVAREAREVSVRVCAPNIGFLSQWNAVLI